MSQRRLRKLQGNRVFEVAEQLGMLDVRSISLLLASVSNSISQRVSFTQSTSEEEESEEEDPSPFNGVPLPKPKPVDAAKLAAEKREQEIAEEKKKEKKRLANKRKKERLKERKRKLKEAQERKKEKAKVNSKAKSQCNSPDSEKNNEKSRDTSSRKKKPKPVNDLDAILAEHKKEIGMDETKEDEAESALLGDELCSNWDLLIRDSRFFDPNFELKKKLRCHSFISLLHSLHFLPFIDYKYQYLIRFGSIALEANDEYVEEDDLSRMKLKSKQKRMLKAKKQQMNQKYGHLKKHKLCLVKFNATKWPSPFMAYSNRTGNIYMEMVKEHKGIKYFRFKYDKEYHKSQMEYKQRCARFDPEEISFFLSQHPYHVSGCLTMSDILNKHGRLEEAVDLVDRGLYRLEKGLHSRFSWITSDCRLDYSVPENRTFFLALWKYSQNLGRRGCVHSAFELTKSLLSLSPLKDPFCSLLCLDFWALRSLEEEWILEFAQCFTPNIHSVDEGQMDALRMFPNWCYSVALAKYRIDLKESIRKQKPFGECDGGKIPMDLTQIKGLSSSILIQQAILLFPEVIGPLLAKASERTLGQNQWKKVMQSEWFIKAKMRRNNIGSLRKLCTIYSERAYALWTGEDLLKWLCKHCLFVLERLENPKSFRIDDNPEINGGDGIDKKENNEDDNDDDVEDDELVELEDLTVFNGLRDAVYGQNQKNRFQMLDINDFSDVVTALPADEMPDAMMQPQEINLQQLQNLDGEELNHVVDQLLAAGVELPPEIQQRLNQGANIQNQSTLQALLYSMMPWVNPIVNQNPQNDNANDDNEPNDE